MYLIRSFKPHGHAYFRGEDDEIYIADCSGRNPNETDDGPLMLDQRYPVHESRAHLKGDFTMLLIPEEARWLIGMCYLKADWWTCRKCYPEKEDV